jgi:hypothetical protein
MNPFKNFEIYALDSCSDKQRKKITWSVEIYYKTEQERQKKREEKVEQFRKIVEALYGTHDKILESSVESITFTTTVEVTRTYP